MQLLVVMIIAGTIGYLLAGSRYGERIDQTTDSVGQSSRGLVERTKSWWRNLFGRSAQEVTFVSWATGAGAAHFPKEFTDWLKGLSPEDASRFTNSLTAYAEGLDYDLDDLVSGEMENKPALMQVFVEAVVVYSNEYRRAQEAQTEARKTDQEKSGKKKSAEASKGDGKAVAEKQPSRRKGNLEETPQATSLA
jgi:hypothetical protein